MKFAVLEGLDGAGKSTQLDLLFSALDRQGVGYEFIKFPRTDAPVYGELVARFLRGELGPIGTVNPYLVALIYAGDRAEAASTIRKRLAEKKLVIADRYVYSNIAYQCGKLESREERKRLAEWIIDLEYNHNAIPKPDLSIFLDVPEDFTRMNLSRDRKGSDRQYLNGKEDIHEKDLAFQSRVRDVYLEWVRNDKQFIKLDCYEGTEMLTPRRIFEKLLEILQTHMIITL